MRHAEHSVLVEAVDAGFLGATTVAGWFLFRDLLEGHPLRTPSVLGQVLLFGQAHPRVDAIDFGAVVLYTGAHFVLFVLFGLVLRVLVRLAAREPVFRFALLVMFVVFELFFYVLIRAVSTEVGALFPLFWVLSANLLASAVMGWYFWRRYPALKRGLERHPLGV